MAAERTIGERVRLMRKARGMTQVALAAKARMTQGSISSLETNQSTWVTGDTLLALATALEVNPYWLNNGAGDPARKMQVTTDQAAVLELYDALTPGNRNAWLASGHGMLDRQPPPEPSIKRPYVVPRKAKA